MDVLMELSEIKSGLIFTLEWNKDRFLRVGDLSRNKLLDFRSPTGYCIDYIDYVEGDDDFYSGKWVFRARASKRVYDAQTILNLFKVGEWLAIKDIARFKRYPHEFYK